MKEGHLKLWSSEPAQTCEYRGHRHKMFVIRIPALSMRAEV